MSQVPLHFVGVAWLTLRSVVMSSIVLPAESPKVVHEVPRFVPAPPEVRRRANLRRGRYCGCDAAGQSIVSISQGKNYRGGIDCRGAGLRVRNSNWEGKTMPGIRVSARVSAMALAATFTFASFGAVAQEKKVRVSMQSAFASSLAVLGPTAQHFTKTATRATAKDLSATSNSPPSRSRPRRSPRPSSPPSSMPPATSPLPRRRAGRSCSAATSPTTFPRPGA